MNVRTLMTTCVIGFSNMNLKKLPIAVLLIKPHRKHAAWIDSQVFFQVVGFSFGQGAHLDGIEVEKLGKGAEVVQAMTDLLQCTLLVQESKPARFLAHDVLRQNEPRENDIHSLPY